MAEVNRALAHDVDGDILLHDCTKPSTWKGPIIFAPQDFVFISFPVYGGRMPRKIDSIFQHIEGHGASCALVAVSGNREYADALLDLFAATVKKGFRPVAAVTAVAQQSLAPEVSSSGLDEGDRKKLAAYGRQIVETMRKGAWPEWKLPKGASIFPVTDREKCVACGHCVSICPASAIPADDPAVTDTEKCIVCAACARYCPTGARQMGTPESREKLAHHLVTTALRWKEAEPWLSEAPR